MTTKQRKYVLIGAALGFVFGLMVYSGDDRSTTTAVALAVGQALVGATVGYYLARDKPEIP